MVGKLGKAPDGSRVAIELTGPLARTIRVAVDGRAQVVDDFGGLDPTSTIRLDGLLFTRLAGGRTDAAAGGVELGGDTEVAARIVEHLNFRSDQLTALSRRDVCTGAAVGNRVPLIVLPKVGRDARG